MVHSSNEENTDLQAGICFGGHIEPCKGILKKKKKSTFSVYDSLIIELSDYYVLII